MWRVLYFLALVLSAKCATAPFIKPCKNGDSACVVESAKAAYSVLVTGVSELGLKNLDPLELPLIVSDEGGLKLNISNSILTGLKGCNLESVKSDIEKKRQSITLKCDLDLTGNYRLDGQLLLFPVRGEGEYKIDIKDIIIKVAGDIVTRTGAEGKPHWHFEKTWRHSFQVKTNVRFNFENLFNGNKALADPVQDFANSNWKEVMQDVAPPVVRAIVSEVIDALNALYEAVPAEQLYVD